MFSISVHCCVFFSDFYGFLYVANLTRFGVKLVVTRKRVVYTVRFLVSMVGGMEFSRHEPDYFTHDWLCGG